MQDVGSRGGQVSMGAGVVLVSIGVGPGVNTVNKHPGRL